VHKGFAKSPIKINLSSRLNSDENQNFRSTNFVHNACAIGSVSTFGQKATSFTGNWNWVVYGTNKEDLPPAYRNMSLKEVPAYAIDLTLKQRGQKLSGSFGIVAHYLARVDEGRFTATIQGNRATVKLTSNFGGSATVVLTLKGNKLAWKTIRSKDTNYFPESEVLRRLRRGEKLPYVDNDQ
jgi:hypothetical protein